MQLHRLLDEMCEVSLTTCIGCRRIFQVQLNHCLPIKRLLRIKESTPFKIASSFNWSPMQGCSGLQIHSTIQHSICSACHERHAEGRPEEVSDALSAVESSEGSETSNSPGSSRDVPVAITSSTRSRHGQGSALESRPTTTPASNI